MARTGTTGSPTLMKWTQRQPKLTIFNKKIEKNTLPNWYWKPLKISTKETVNTSYEAQTNAIVRPDTLTRHARTQAQKNHTFIQTLKIQHSSKTPVYTRAHRQHTTGRSNHTHYNSITVCRSLQAHLLLIGSGGLTDMGVTARWAT